MNATVKHPRIIFACDECGSTDVVGTANAIWNTRTQQWDAADILDDTFCEVCKCEVDISSRDMTTEELAKLEADAVDKAFRS